MNKYLYCKVLTANPNLLYMKLNLDEEETSYLKKLGVYCMPSDNGTQMVGIFELRTLLSR